MLAQTARKGLQYLGLGSAQLSIDANSIGGQGDVKASPFEPIREVERPAPASPGFGARVFLTKTGQPWVRAQGYVNDEIAKQFAKLLDSLGLKRPGLNFYALRHTFSTIAEECADPPAHRLLMGHSDNSMAASYRERIDDSRLRRITDHVRKWLAQ